MPILDVFSSDAFSTISLTQGLENVPYVPSLLGSLNLFDPLPIRTEAVGIEERGGVLNIIATSPRGSEPKEKSGDEKRKLRYFNTVALSQKKTIRPAEIQNIRAFGTESELVQIQNEIARHYAGPAGLIQQMNLTWEYHRLGAIQGKVLDADGTSVINDWYDEFNIQAPAPINFKLSDSATKIRKELNKVTRSIIASSGGAFLPTSQIYALAGNDLYDELITHPAVEKTYEGWAAATDLRKGGAFSAFSFGDINWINYRGTDGASPLGIPSDSAKLFPVGAPGVFQVAWAPDESIEFANTPGKPLYGKVITDPLRSQWVSAELYSYPLFMCTRPGMLRTLKLT